MILPLAEAGVEVPALRDEPSNPLGHQNMPERGLQELASRLAAQGAVAHAPALHILVAVPDGREAVLARAVQHQDILERCLHTRLALWRAGGDRADPGWE